MFGAQTQAQSRDDQPEVAERPDEGTQRPPRLRHPRGTAEPGSQADLNEPARPGRDRIPVEAEAPPPRDVGRDEAETGRDICAQEGKVAECRLRAVEIRQGGRDRDDEERRGGGERDCPRPDHRERRPQERQHRKDQPADPPWNAVSLLELPPSHREGRARASQADRAGRESLLAERDSRHERRAEVRRGGKRTDRQVLHPGSTEDPGPQQVEHEIAPQAEECRQGLEAAVDARRDREGHAQVVAVAGQPLVLPAAREHEGQRGQHRVEEQSVDGAERSRELFPIAHRLPGRLLDRHEEIPEEVVRPEVSEEEGRESHVEERGMALEPERTGEQGEAEDRRRQGVAAVQGRRGRGPRQRQREGQTGEGVTSQSHQGELPLVRLVGRQPARAVDASHGREHGRHGEERRRQLERVDARPDHARDECEAEQAQEEIAERAVPLRRRLPLPRLQRPDRGQDHDRGHLKGGELPGP